MLDRSKLNSAGSLGSKNGPPSGFGPCAAEPGTVALGGCWLTDDRVGFCVDPGFILIVGESGDCVNGFWFKKVSWKVGWAG